MTTLREDVINGVTQLLEDDFSVEVAIGYIATVLEATGAPAYCRVATDLRGEWEPDASQPVTP